MKENHTNVRKSVIWEKYY